MVGAAVELVALGVGDVLVRLVVDEGGDRLGHAGVDPAPTAARMAAPVAVVSTLVGTLTGRPVTSALIWRHRWRMRDAPSARAALVASSAALLMHRVTPLPGPTSGRRPYVIPHVNPYVIPHALGCVPLASLAECISAGQSPFVGLAPLGGVERPGRAVRFARLMHRCVRAFLRTEGPQRLRRQAQPCPGCHLAWNRRSTAPMRSAILRLEGGRPGRRGCIK